MVKIPSPSSLLKTQKQLGIAEKEKEVIAANRHLIELMEGKIWKVVSVM